ncbi:hypothetical protein JM93_04018 [Roseibium hamelinense]|uniref:Uncharacterized protein n=1 Tax=Roseibium hamelinense TaxID=150831 RepID=A0A562SIL4_9HYPH|nr:hypothetical protein JM93_04018 [Roseibium hamelinense]
MLGTLGFLIVIAHFSAGPFEPKPTIGQTIGETAADIRNSAVRALKGQPAPKPEPAGWDTDRILQTVGPILGASAIILGLLSFVLREDRKLAAMSVSLGAMTIGFQLFTWTVIIIAGVILLGYILMNLTQILGEWNG